MGHTNTIEERFQGRLRVLRSWLDLLKKYFEIFAIVALNGAELHFDIEAKFFRITQRTLGALRVPVPRKIQNLSV